MTLKIIIKVFLLKLVYLIIPLNVNGRRVLHKKKYYFLEVFYRNGTEIY